MDPILKLIDLLGSSDAGAEERALALLSLQGRRAVDSLLTAASSPDPALRAGAVSALGRIADPRGRRAVTVGLADREPGVRAAAATALSAFPLPESAARLRGMLEREERVEIRIRAAATLVDLFNTGVVEALDTLLSLASSKTEDRRVRMEALKVLSSLPPAEARGIAAGLVDDPDLRMAQAASRLAGDALTGVGDSGVTEALADLDSTDYFTYRRAASLLASLGERALPLLVQALGTRAADPAACARVASVLREAVRGRERAAARFLDDLEHLVPLGLLVDIIGESRDRTALYHLKGVIDRLEAVDAALLPAAPGSSLADEAAVRETIIAKSHYYLARADSRVAWGSLRAILSRPGGRLLREILLAVETLGGREELVDLLAHYEREDRWMKERLADTIRRLMKKARVRPDDPLFARLDSTRRDNLTEILAATDSPRRDREPPPLTGGPRPRAARRTADTR